MTNCIFKIIKKKDKKHTFPNTMGIQLHEATKMN